TRGMFHDLIRLSDQQNRLKLFTDNMDLKKIISSYDENFMEHFKLPNTNSVIDTIIDIKQKPVNKLTPENFSLFIEQTSEWLKWFDSFIDTFHQIIEWLKTQNIIV
ncbi:unnamed protein product, partial [Didymodactylos carnosus]